MSISSSLLVELTSFLVFVVLPLLAVVKLLIRRSTAILNLVSRFGRSEIVAFFRKKFREWSAQQTEKQALQRAKQSVETKLTLHLADAIFMYSFFGLMVATWVLYCGVITLNIHHYSQWIVMGALSLITVLCAPLGGHFRAAAIGEKEMALQLWQSCKVRSLKTYVALLAVPTFFTAAAFTVVSLQRLGGN